ncbi:TIGR02281 family clan AA aspartic protease [Wolbachia endosymbiont of Mansonella ozzardi]|uniref:TIGR02281 family clan AA aspartic protease n=1 Tax=Wolbachia endosymbiont of Mansonella ozzardi TaxID=137464 RepID=UPI001CE081EA|nr:TIGR02281 family clan AA aspartic protease [Wolbachia endosymbiont of Mansonella ozzardi]MCA4774839.1 TIGR02281 family clan AA aspartic protease [Wolbachia endosymbiont of Mansonella ozzardi]
MNAVKNLVIWLLIIVTTAMFIDSQGDKLRNRFLSTFLPYKGRIQNSGSIEFTKSHDGHFYIQAQVNGRNITFLLDTGATDIVLSQKDAVNAGINLKNIQDFQIHETAKGQIRAGVVQIPQVKIGNFLINDVQASVNTHSMSHSLLGMSFLRYFCFTIRGNKLILYRESAC